jgi:crotonobetainyl-CoA:carnitine CoA-transferase CaiB-like acyl-CoA transferase
MTVPVEQSDSGPPQPLSGYWVLDLAGPMGVYCGKLMADMGADGKTMSIAGRALATSS